MLRTSQQPSEQPRGTHRCSPRWRRLGRSRSGGSGAPRRRWARLWIHLGRPAIHSACPRLPALAHAEHISCWPNAGRGCFRPPERCAVPRAGMPEQRPASSACCIALPGAAHLADPVRRSGRGALGACFANAPDGQAGRSARHRCRYARMPGRARAWARASLHALRLCCPTLQWPHLQIPHSCWPPDPPAPSVNPCTPLQRPSGWSSTRDCSGWRRRPRRHGRPTLGWRKPSGFSRSFRRRWAVDQGRCEEQSPNSFETTQQQHDTAWKEPPGYGRISSPERGSAQGQQCIRLYATEVWFATCPEGHWPLCFC